MKIGKLFLNLFSTESIKKLETFYKYITDFRHSVKNVMVIVDQLILLRNIFLIIFWIFTRLGFTFTLVHSSLINFSFSPLCLKSIHLNFKVFVSLNSHNEPLPPFITYILNHTADSKNVFVALFPRSTYKKLNTNYLGRSYVSK